MTMRYFKYELKKSIWPTIILTILGILIYIPALASNDFVNPRNPIINLGLIASFLGMACTAVPIYELSYLMKKRSIDEYYSLPIKRSILITTKFLSGFLKILISYTIAFFLGLFVIIVKGHNLSIQYYFPYYLFSVILGFSLYAFNSFVYSRANTIIDGLIFINLYSTIFIFVVGTVHRIFSNVFAYYSIKNIISSQSFSPLIFLTQYYDNLIRYGSGNNEIMWFSYIMWLIIGALSVCGLVYSTKIDKAERSEQISESYFGYRVLIPTYLISVILFANLNPFDSVVMFFLVSILYGAGLVGYIIYRRTFKLPIKYWIILSSSVLIGIFINLIL